MPLSPARPPVAPGMGALVAPAFKSVRGQSRTVPATGDIRSDRFQRAIIAPIT